MTKLETNYPPFCSNSEDDNHCLQASMRMVLGALGIKTKFRDVNQMSDYEIGHYSWTPRATISLSEQVPGTKLYCLLDYEQFAERGEEYFRELNEGDPQWFELQKKHASTGFNKEQTAAKELVSKKLVETTKLDFKNIEKLLEDNLLIAVVDAGKLANENWSSGHFVVVYEQDDEYFTLHDPGLPPKEAWKVSKKNFMEAFKNELISVPRG